MDITRNQYFLAGLVLLFLGIQFRVIESFSLTPELTQFLAERTGHPLAAMNAASQTVTPDEKPMAKKDGATAGVDRLVPRICRRGIGPA